MEVFPAHHRGHPSGQTRSGYQTLTSLWSSCNSLSRGEDRPKILSSRRKTGGTGEGLAVRPPKLAAGAFAGLSLFRGTWSPWRLRVCRREEPPKTSLTLPRKLRGGCGSKTRVELDTRTQVRGWSPSAGSARRGPCDAQRPETPQEASFVTEDVSKLLQVVFKDLCFSPTVTD